MTRRIRRWTQAGVLNSVPFATLLRGESIVANSSNARRRKSEVLQIYKEAVVQATDLKILQYHAMFTERFSDVLSRVYGEKDESQTYLRESINLYGELVTPDVIRLISCEQYIALVVTIELTSQVCFTSNMSSAFHLPLMIDSLVRGQEIANDDVTAISSTISSITAG
eukprot:CAMPEP_0116573598 /NCGR_PEP_ID=MMETSP0397-20121206/18881_1 /TAXON_ID=216820 /ORGANISM="Cyclophora tenuis, Strain ECT3854" /LENGTH=167 /DNA_ID=CAMNT_0004102177 /DNA_START=116 /DNA_END=619 /DNA_ORIENTATION=-